MSDQQQQTTEAHRDGSRWTHARPTSQQVNDWFGEQPLHDGMDQKRDRYIGGVVVIGAEETVKELRHNASGNPFVFEYKLPVFTPYVKVDTRVAYFWDLVRTMNEGEDKYVGVIEPMPQPRIEDPANPYYNGNLPDGYSVVATRQGENVGGAVARFLVCTMRAAIYERDAWAARVRGDAPPRPILQGIGSKQTAILKRNGYADEFAVMKCETGAVGRALGMAGILVVGTGVASAEDMQEIGSAEAGAEAAAPPRTPAVVGPAVVSAPTPDSTAGGGDAPEAEVMTPEQEDELRRSQLTALTAQLREQFPESYQAYIEWWGERGFGAPDELNGPALKGAVTKLARTLDAARRGQA